MFFTDRLKVPFRSLVNLYSWFYLIWLDYYYRASPNIIYFFRHKAVAPLHYYSPFISSERNPKSTREGKALSSNTNTWPSEAETPLRLLWMQSSSSVKTRPAFDVQKVFPGVHQTASLYEMRSLQNFSLKAIFLMKWGLKSAGRRWPRTECWALWEAYVQHWAMKRSISTW